MQPERLWTRLRALGEIGRVEHAKPGHGVTRLAFTEEDLRARQLVIGWMQEADLAVRVDPAGNIIGRQEGSKAGWPALMVGSHLDTVREGGVFDGSLGVVAGIELAQALREEGQALRHPLEVVVFSDEEGVRFGTGLFGSRAMAGLLDPNEVFRARDERGVELAQALCDAGLDPETVTQARRDPATVGAYLELHIEQGAVLAHRDIVAGVVTGIVGIWRRKYTWRGVTNHAGTTPMYLRRDALLGAAEFVLAVNRLVKERVNAGVEMVGTVGWLRVHPGAVNVVPGEAALYLELRGMDLARVQEVLHELHSVAQDLARRNSLELEASDPAVIPPIALSPVVMEEVEGACQDLRISWCRLPSGAGHDAQNMALSAPAGMIFVPSQGGLSHCPEEYTLPEHVAAGARILRRTVERLDAALAGP